jgi:predicted transcriptional regulator
VIGALKQYIMTKEIVATAIKEMPQEFDLDELIERLIFIEKVEEGLKDMEEGRTITHEEMKQKIDGWRK